MSSSKERLIEQIHASPQKIVLTVSGGGSRAIAELLAAPGASRTVLEAIVPYCRQAMAGWLGGGAGQGCCSHTARAMAMVAFRRACKYNEDETEHPSAGVACTAALTTDRPKRGPHRAHVAMQTVQQTVTWSVELKKGRRSRVEEEQLVARLLINAVAEACGVDNHLELPLLEGEHVDKSSATAPKPWQDLLLKRVESVCCGGSGKPTGAIFPGAFNPLHVGHRRMTEIAEEVLGVPVAMELSIENVDKPPLDYFEIEQRLEQFDPNQAVWLTRTATFEEKSRLFPEATFIVGVDTLRRIAQMQYYGNDPAACTAALDRIVSRRCRFLVFGRDLGAGFVRLGDLDLPEPLRSICREVPAEQFREDVSSTEIRRSPM